MTETQNETQDTRLDKRVANLPPEVPPPAGVWSEIQNAIAEPSSATASVTAPVPKVALESDRLGSGRESAWAAALSGVAAVLTFAVILMNDSSIDERAGGDPAGFAAVQGFEIEGLDSAELMRVRSNLHFSLTLALDELAPETRVTVVENLARIDQARTDIDEALRNDPANQLLKQMLLSSYTQEITLLNEFTLMARSAPQRTRL